MNQLLLITTGGTIASEPTDEGLAPSLSSRQLADFIGGLTAEYDVAVEDYFSLTAPTYSLRNGSALRAPLPANTATMTESF